MVFAQPIIAGYGVTNGFEVHIQDRRGGTVEELLNTTQTFISALSERPEIARVQTNFNTSYPQYVVEVDAARCVCTGISPSEVLNALSGYVGGIYSSNMYKFSKLYQVMIQASPEYRLDTQSLNNIFVRTATIKNRPQNEKSIYHHSNNRLHEQLRYLHPISATGKYYAGGIVP